MTPRAFAQHLQGELHLEMSEDTFEQLALEAFSLQYQHLEPYRRLCQGRGIDPSSTTSWQQIPAVPVAAFKSLRLHLATPRETFRSSGTTGGRRSVHFHPFPDLYRRVIDATFQSFCMPPELLGAPCLALVPSRRQIDDSSLGFMIDHVMTHLAGADSCYAFGSQGVDDEAAADWCRRRLRDHRPGLIIATSFALAQWLETLNADDLAWQLPVGSAVFDTGGFKGRSRELSRAQLAGQLTRHLGVPTTRVVREYGMTELTSQFYTRALLGGDDATFVGPPWLRARLLDPESLQAVTSGKPGLLSIFDLANVGSAIHLLTQDLGMQHDAGFRLLGRASGAELRGCSLTVEELEGR